MPRSSAHCKEDATTAASLAEAVDLYRRALQIAPAHPEIHENLAGALAALGVDNASAAGRRA